MRKDDTAREFLTDKDILRITRDALDEGRTKQEVYVELSRRHDRKEYLAQIMSKVPEAEARAKHKAANKVLGILMNLVCSLNIVLPLFCMINGTKYRLRVLDPVLALIFFWLTFLVYRMNDASVYRLIGLIGVVGLLQSMKLYSVQLLWGFASVLLFGTISILSFYLGDRLRSDWTPDAPAEDDQGPGTHEGRRESA